MHSYCHQLNCRIKYCPKYLLGLGLEDGENCERFWSLMPWNVNTAYMRPENRRDVITAHVFFVCEKAWRDLPENLNLKHRKALKILEIATSEKFAPRSYSALLEDLVKFKDPYPNSDSRTQKDFNRERILDSARNIVRLQGLQARKKGAKKTALIAKAIVASNSSLNEQIQKFNATFGEDLSSAKVFELIQKDLSHMDSVFSKEIEFWKACEQILITRRDCKDSIKYLQSLIDDLNIFISAKQDSALVELYLKKSIRIENLINSLNETKSNLDKTFNSFKGIMEEINIFTL